MKKKIIFKIKKKIDNNHYIGIIFINATNITNSNKLLWDKNKLHLNLTSIFLNKLNEYPIFKIDNLLLTNSFRYKKYIKEIIKEKYAIKNKYIITIKLFNNLDNLHNYIIILKSKKNLNNGKNIQSYGDNGFYWRTYINNYICNDKLSQMEIYKYIQKINNYEIKPEKYNSKYIIDYNSITQKLSNIDFGY